MKKSNAFIFFAVFFCVSNLHAQKERLQILNTSHIASSGGWDYTQVGPIIILENVTTKKSALTLSLYTTTHLVYLPAKEFEA